MDTRETMDEIKKAVTEFKAYTEEMNQVTAFVRDPKKLLTVNEAAGK